MEIIKSRNELEIHFSEKVVKLRGHKDRDAFSLYTESLETSPSLSPKDREELLEELKRRDDIVIR